MLLREDGLRTDNLSDTGPGITRHSPAASACCMAAYHDWVVSRVCVFGDSIAYGSWDPEGGGWVGRLRTAGCRRVDRSDPNFDPYTAIYNCGIAGNRVGDVLARFDVEAAAREAHVVVIAIGINDVPHQGKSGTPIAVFRDHYATLVARACAVASDVLLVTPTNVDETRSEHNHRNTDIATVVDCVETIAADLSLPLVRVFGVLTADDLHDGLHPNSAGHEKLAQAIIPVVFALPALAWTE